MASLLIRNLDPDLHALIKARARVHHRSVEEEARETLRSAIARDASASLPPANLMTIATRYFGAAGGVDLQLPARGEELVRAPVDFSSADYP